MGFHALFIADPQPAEQVEPCKCPLHNPPPAPEPAAVRGVAMSQQRLDAFCTQVKGPNTVAGFRVETGSYEFTLVGPGRGTARAVRDVATFMLRSAVCYALCEDPK